MVQILELIIIGEIVVEVRLHNEYGPVLNGVRVRLVGRWRGSFVTLLILVVRVFLDLTGDVTKFDGRVVVSTRSGVLSIKKSSVIPLSTVNVDVPSFSEIDLIACGVTSLVKVSEIDLIACGVTSLVKDSIITTRKGQIHINNSKNKIELNCSIGSVVIYRFVLGILFVRVLTVILNKSDTFDMSCDMTDEISYEMTLNSQFGNMISRGHFLKSHIRQKTSVG
uniref:CSON000004 protein n=1 Tax=Culicoides sonorensis TaxID=179676 RepID=A0A336KW20_CULSO